MNLSHYVVRTLNREKTPVYYHTVTHTEISINANEAELYANFCMAGQEEAAVRHAVANWDRGDTLILQVAPTWECNLRCTHCIVLDRLKDIDHNTLDVPNLVDFAKRFIAHHKLQKINFSYYGGEPLLSIDTCNEVLDAIESTGLLATTSLVTNLAMPLTPKHLDFLTRIPIICVSIDGPEAMHNAQRIPKTGTDNTYRTTLANLKTLVLAGLKDRLSVKTCLQKQFASTEERKEFLKTLLRFGIDPINIKLGTMAPTTTSPTPNPFFLQGLKTARLTSQGCCRYREHIILVDNTNNIFSDFYQYTKLGTIYDDIGHLQEQQIRFVLRNLPIMVDSKCRKCPVAGYCWGGCSMLSCVRPYSSYCNQKVIIDYVRDRAANGTLIA